MTDDEDSIARALPESIARQLRDLAQVPETSFVQFRAMLETEIGLLHQLAAIPRRKPITAKSDISPALDRVATAAQALDQAFGALLVELGSFDEGTMIASSLLEEALDDATGKSASLGWRVAAYREWLTTLIAATKVADNRAADLYPSAKVGHPTGSGHPFFDYFVKRLYEISSTTDGRPWTCWRKADNSPGGTLIQALDLLRDDLPKSNFFPNRNLANVLEGLAKRYRPTTPAILN